MRGSVATSTGPTEPTSTCGSALSVKVGQPAFRYPRKRNVSVQALHNGASLGSSINGLPHGTKDTILEKDARQICQVQFKTDPGIAFKFDPPSGPSLSEQHFSCRAFRSGVGVSLRENGKMGTLGRTDWHGLVATARMLEGVSERT